MKFMMVFKKVQTKESKINFGLLNKFWTPFQNKFWTPNKKKRHSLKRECRFFKSRFGYNALGRGVRNGLLITKDKIYTQRGNKLKKGA